MIRPEQAQRVVHVFTDSCDRIGLIPADPDVGSLLAIMVAGHWLFRGGGDVLLGQLLREIEIACRDAERVDYG
jgi:hypothetical protein